jgi:uncharacterized membrane protein
MSENYRIVYTGNVSPGKSIEQVIDLFSEKFRLDRSIAERVIKADRPISMKKDLMLDKAEKYLAVLQQIGLEVEIDPKPPEPEPEPAQAASGFELEPLDHGGADTTEVLEHPSEPGRCPKCGSYNMEIGICQDCGIVASKYLAAQAAGDGEGSAVFEAQSGDNPYTAPEAGLVEPMENEVTGPVSVPVGNAFYWIGQGWSHFKSSPLAWIGALVVWVIIQIVVGIIPIVNFLAPILLGPVIVAGFMYGCAEQDAGGDFSVSHLFAGFSGNVGQLILVGVFYFILLILYAVIMVGVTSVFVGDASISMFEQPQAMATMGNGAIAGLIIFGLLLLMPIMMSYLFAPALVMLDDMSAFQAMKYSFVGCLKNILPLILYSLVSLVLLFVGMIPFFLGLLIVMPIFVGMIPFLLGLLIVMPILTAGIYVAYRDIYFS